MALKEFGHGGFRWRTTLRGRIATAMTHPAYSAMFRGEIEGEYAEWMPDPTRDRAWTLMTWCSIRVSETFRGTLVRNSQINILYRGGSIDREHQWWPPDGARCLPFDSQIIALVEVAPGVFMPDTAVTTSLEPWDIPPSEHPSVEMAREIARELRGER